MEKVKRREATKERNKVKARERYRRIKAEKDSKKEETKTEDVKKFKETAPKNMSFKQFARYMNQYEGVKKAYETKRQENMKKSKTTSKQKIKQTIMPTFHPKNYPLAHLYDPSTRQNTNYF